MKKFWTLLLLSSCMVGPKYHKPEVALPEQFTEKPKLVANELDEQDLIDWWSQLDDPFLDELLAKSCSSNFDLRIALEQVFQARFELQASGAALFPQFNLDMAAVRTQQSSNIFSPLSTAMNLASSFAGAAGDSLSISPIQNFFQLGFELFRIFSK